MVAGGHFDGRGRTGGLAARPWLLEGKTFLAGAAAALLVLCAATPARTQQIPLPPDLQQRVNKAIDDGVEFLKTAQNAFGTWTLDKEHPLGYAALGGLTLLVCDVPADDPAVQKAAKFVRASCPATDQTYEIALSILFLDKLGEVRKNHPRAEAGEAKKDRKRAGTNEAKKDRDLIESLALRLIAGQSPTGGWTYKCPILRSNQAAQLLKGVRAKKLNKAALGDVRDLPVLQDPEKLWPEDPPDKRFVAIWGTTDNSNTQFAVLAIWAARRHGLPVDRTLKLMVKRFETGQNPDGSWPYDYKFRGGLPERPAMDCVGLLGLAIGNGMANDAALKDGRPDFKAAGIIGGPGLAGMLLGVDGITKRLAFEEAKKKGEKDQRVLNGFLALDKHVGQPSGKMDNLTLVDLYKLWSIERVAVLYNLPLLGKKDWYRWGAEILVANQAQAGNWQNGLYPGSTPPCDTCFALLFLKRSNLASDLTAALALNPGNLAKDLDDKLHGGFEKKETPTPVPSIDLSKLFGKTDASKTPTPGPTVPVAAAPRAPARTTPVAQSEAPPNREEGGNAMLFVFLGLLALLVVGGGILAYFLLHSRNEEDDEDDRPRKTKGKAAKTRQDSSSNSKELRSKTGVRSRGKG